MHGQNTYNQSQAAFCVKSDLGLELIRVLLRCFQATGVLQNYDRKLDAEESLEDLRELGLEVKDARTGNYLAPGSGGVQPVSDSARGANVNGKERRSWLHQRIWQPCHNWQALGWPGCPCLNAIVFFWEKLSILGKAADLNKEAQMLQQDVYSCGCPFAR